MNLQEWLYYASLTAPSCGNTKNDSQNLKVKHTFVSFEGKKGDSNNKFKK